MVVTQRERCLPGRGTDTAAENLAGRGDSMVASSSASLRWWSSRCRISASSRSNAGLSARQSSSFRCLKRYIAREIYPRLLSLTSPGGRQR